MSVPVRYSAAANYAVADSGLTNTLNNNDQEQQYQHYVPEELYNSHLYSQHQHQLNSVYGFNSILEEQQQLMQQSTSMSVSVKPQEDLVGAANSAATAYHRHHQQMDQEQASTSAKAREEMLAAAAAHMNELPTTSAMAAAAAESANTAAINGSSHTAEMRTEWMRMSDEGRYGTPGAAGLDYQKFELEQQHQTTPNLMDQTMEPSLTDNEKNNSNNNLEDELTSMSSEELYNTLKEYDALQDKYHTVLLLPKESRVS